MNMKRATRKMNLQIAECYTDGEAFKPGEVWESPKGTRYLVKSYEWSKSKDSPKKRQAVLRAGLDGLGRKVLRDVSATENWMRIQANPVESRQQE